METKKFVQFGTFPIIIFGIPLIMFSLQSYDAGFFETWGLIYVGLSALMIGCILFMYKMVIEIDENQISFKFGIGLFKRTYQIYDLTSCSSVRSSLLNGFGIRKIANGWLYNISGLDAIELQFIDKKNVIRIGTNKPDEISRIVNNLVEKKLNINESPSIASKYTLPTSTQFWIGSVAIAMAILFFLYTNKNDAIRANNDKIIISGIYSKSIDYSQIASIDTLSAIPEREARTNGSYFRGQAKGYFKLYKVGSAYLNLNLKYPPFIRIILRNDEYIFLNFCDAKETSKFYKNVEIKLNKSK